MPDPIIFQIENGEFALEIVDTAEVGYQPTWQGPGGVTSATATIADYDPSSVTFQCQVTSGAITAAPDTTTQDIPASWCAPGKTLPTPKETAFSLEISLLQDAPVLAGLSAYLFTNDTKEAYFYVGWNGTDPPKAIGRVRLASATIGGPARSVLTADVTMPCSMKPDIAFGPTLVTATTAPEEEPAAV